jgi:hypothetical protein
MHLIERMTRRAGLLFLAAVLVASGLSASMVTGQEKTALKDFTSIKLEDYGIKPVQPQKDPKTGFVVGGKNATELIKQLTEINGLSIRALETDMRPGAASNKGFLGKEEKLLDVLAGDNRFVVDEQGLTHQELARHLHAMGAIWTWQTKNQQAEMTFLYHGQKYQVKGHSSLGAQPSPFDDDTKSGSNVMVTNLTNGKEVGYGLLVPFMVERYGFYEGHGTPYRLEPRRVLEVFDFLKRK